MKENRTVNLLTSALIASDAPSGCPESISRFTHPYKGTERVTYQKLNRGKTIRVMCAGSEKFEGCHGCVFHGRGNIIGGNI